MKTLCGIQGKGGPKRLREHERMKSELAGSAASSWNAATVRIEIGGAGVDDVGRPRLRSGPDDVDMDSMLYFKVGLTM